MEKQKDLKINLSNYIPFTTLKIILVFIIVYYLYKIKGFSKVKSKLENILDPKNIKLNNREKDFIKEKFSNITNSELSGLLYDTPQKDLVFKNPYNDLIIYNLGSGLLNTYPVNLGIFFKKKIHPLNIIETRGSIENIIELLNSKVDFAFVDEDILASYLCKKKNFINNRIKEFINNRVINRNNIKITGMVPMYYQYFLTLTIQGTNIINWDDLSGRTIGITNEYTNSYHHFTNLVNITKQFDDTYNPVIKKYNKIVDMINDLKNNVISAIFINCNQKNNYIRELTKDEKVRFITFRNQPHQIKNMFNLDLYYEEQKSKKTLIKNNFNQIFEKTLNLSHFYKNMNSNNFIYTHSTRMILVCRHNLDKRTCDLIFNNLVSNNQNMKKHINNFDNVEEVNNYIDDAFNYMEFASINKIIPLNKHVREQLIKHKFIKEITTEQSKLLINN
jgi:TRAP-type uncharacterized transport system substrate-binding protein